MQEHDEFDPNDPRHGLEHRDPIDGFDDDTGAGEDDRLVRPYVIAQGRDHADSVRLDMISVVIAAKRAEVDELALEPEQLRILELCRRPQSVAEVSAHLDIPVAVVKVLLSDLLNRGLALARAPYTAKSPVSRDVLQAVLDGIQRL
ncbi:MULTISPECIES: DUF742 domain-containing protein [Nocardiopsis]|uniref:DUF742 domain-containing protein n=1 Tax=Nocardiopsis alba TaxID=53437 RepID=A0ABV5DX00_9ACTN|nr:MULTISPECIES: DUF742 domain-containing protein [Nocardiopsis]MEC3894993.1 DUF742 domain-containing protein [Nocardiopsis sp. LDBS1602]